MYCTEVAYKCNSSTTKILFKYTQSSIKSLALYYLTVKQLIFSSLDLFNPLYLSNRKLK